MGRVYFVLSEARLKRLAKCRRQTVLKHAANWRPHLPAPRHHPRIPTILLGGVQERRSRAQTFWLCPISPQCAGLVNDSYANYLSPYVNLHHTCFFLETITDAKGKECRRGRYEEMKTLL